MASGPVGVFNPLPALKRKETMMVTPTTTNGNNQNAAQNHPPPHASAGPPDELDNLLVFEGGQFRPGDPLNLGDVDGQDLERALRDRGFRRCSCHGDDSGMNIVLFEGDGSSWVIEVSTCCYGCLIFVAGWPDL